jgi:hypothetical protein
VNYKRSYEVVSGPNEITAIERDMKLGISKINLGLKGYEAIL